MLDASMPPIPEHVTSIISAHSRLMAQVRHAVASEAKITPSQAIMIMSLGNETVKAGDIIRLGYYPGTNVSYNLHMLTRSGYIKRSSFNGDRRTKFVSLTKKGIQLCKQLRRDLAPVAFTIQQTEEADNA